MVVALEPAKARNSLESPTVGAAFEAFLPSPKRKLTTRSKYRYKLAAFLMAYGETAVGQISEALIAQWFAHLEQRYSEGTMAIYRSCFLAFFNYCRQQKWLVENPAAGLPRYSARPAAVKTANEEHLSQALTFCGILSRSTDPLLRRNAALFALAAVSGARRSNLMMTPYREMVLALDNPVVQPGVGHIYAVATTGKEKGEIVFGEWHADLVRNYLEVRTATDHNRLWVHFRAGSLGQPLGPNGLGKARRQVCRIADVPIITFQEMRKLRGTQVARKFGLELAAEVLGHRSGTRVVREHYYDPDKQAARIAVLVTAMG